MPLFFFDKILFNFRFEKTTTLAIDRQVEIIPTAVCIYSWKLVII